MKAHVRKDWLYTIVDLLNRSKMKRYDSHDNIYIEKHLQLKKETQGRS